MCFMFASKRTAAIAIYYHTLLVPTIIHATKALLLFFCTKALLVLFVLGFLSES